MERECEVEGCPTTVIAIWGHLCEKHRGRMRRHGDPNVVLRLWKASRAERLERYTDRSAGPDGCWSWTGCKNANGYGVISAHDGGTAIASRAAYEEAHNVKLAREIDVMHLCNNPPCCNPAHLRAGTRAENHAYMITCGRSGYGERNSQAKLTDAQVAELRRLRADGMNLTELSAIFGITPGSVSRIATGKRRA